MTTKHPEIAEIASIIDRRNAHGFNAFSGTHTNVNAIRDGYARIIVQWIGGESFTVAWEYAPGEWCAAQYDRDAVAYEVAVTLDAMCADR